MIAGRALVTGATGFVGRNLVRRLHGAGWEVHAVIRQESRVTSVSSIDSMATCHRFAGTAESMSSIVGGIRPTVVFHLASHYVAEHATSDVEAMIRSNLLFGAQLVEAMSLAGASLLINTGTAWQHYRDREYSPVNLYAATKQAFEMILGYYVEARGMRVVTLKLHDTYGIDDPRPKLINLLQAVQGSTAPLVMSGGEQQVELVHVDDVTQAYVVAAERLAANLVMGHERYSVASGAPRTLREVVAIYEEALGCKLPIIWGGRPYRAREVMEPWRGATLPGWQPEIDLASGFARLRSQCSRG